MAETYKRAKIYMYAYIDVLCDTEDSKESVEQKAVDLAINFVNCLNDMDVEFDLVECD